MVLKILTDLESIARENQYHTSEEITLPELHTLAMILAETKTQGSTFRVSKVTGNNGNTHCPLMQWE
jgi:hypothetical protein